MDAISGDPGTSDTSIHRHDRNASGQGLVHRRGDARRVHRGNGDGVDLAGDQVFDHRQLTGQLTFPSRQFDKADARGLARRPGAAVDQAPAFIGVTVGDVGNRLRPGGSGQEA